MLIYLGIYLLTIKVIKVIDLKETNRGYRGGFRCSEKKGEMLSF